MKKSIFTNLEKDVRWRRSLEEEERLGLKLNEIEMIRRQIAIVTFGLPVRSKEFL